MANQEQLNVLSQGAEVWNRWSQATRLLNPDFTGAKLARIDLEGANLRGADFRKADLSRANLARADFTNANLSGANLSWSRMYNTSFVTAQLKKAKFLGAKCWDANFFMADLSGAHLHSVVFLNANLGKANLTGANLSGSNLRHANVVEADLSGANLTDCCVYGISAWKVRVSDKTKQTNLIVTDAGEPEIRIDNIEVAQFVYLLLSNEKIRGVIDTVGRKGVLLLGRFTGGRMVVLERLSEALRSRGWVPIVFNFDKPETKDFTETVRLLAGMAHFVIADITNPRSAPLELQATVPECMVPFIPILEKGEEPFAMLQDLWIKHRDWVQPPIRYPCVDRLIEVLDPKIVEPAKARFAALLAKRAEEMPIEDI
jgi:uncharacterized protein YjbI with pentapeptide repeats